MVPRPGALIPSGLSWSALLPAAPHQALLAGPLRAHGLLLSFKVSLALVRKVLPGHTAQMSPTHSASVQPTEDHEKAQRSHGP